MGKTPNYNCPRKILTSLPRILSQGSALNMVLEEFDNCSYLAIYRRLSLG